MERRVATNSEVSRARVQPCSASSWPDLVGGCYLADKNVLYDDLWAHRHRKRQRG
jgi:hypothetical protein